MVGEDFASNVTDALANTGSECRRIAIAQFCIVFASAFALLLWTSPLIDSYYRNPDHGYQLSLGRQIFFGKFPFVGSFLYYGPMVALTSWFGLLFSHSLIPETILCSAGYALSIALVFAFVRKHASIVLALFTAALAFLLLARFYKWYYWLFPLLSLLSLDSLFSSTSQPRSRVLVAGIITGVSGLYRLDLAIALAGVFAVASLLLLARQKTGFKTLLRNWTWYAAAVVTPFLLWFALLVSQGGRVTDYFSATIGGSARIVQLWSLPIPKLDTKNPFSEASQIKLTLFVLPLTYVACITAGLIGARRLRDADARNRGTFLMLTGLFGLSLFSQALRRFEVQHLLQVIPPFIIGIASFGYQFLNYSLVIRYALSIVAVLFWLPLLITLGQGGRVDLSSFRQNIVSHYSGLHKMKPEKDEPIYQTIKTIQAKTVSGDSVLVVALACQVHFFSERVMCGFFNELAPGIYDRLNWRLRELRVIQASPPAVVLVENDFFRDTIDNKVKTFYPELFDYLSTYYAPGNYTSGPWIILERKKTVLPESLPH